MAKTRAFPGMALSASSLKMNILFWNMFYLDLYWIVVWSRFICFEILSKQLNERPKCSGKKKLGFVISYNQSAIAWISSKRYLSISRIKRVWILSQNSLLSVGDFEQFSSLIISVKDVVLYLWEI